MSADPLTVACPDCTVPAGRACATSGEFDPTTVHGERQRIADLRSLEHGVCALCAAPMVRGTVEGSPVDAWHPDPAHAAACPVIPDPDSDWNAYAATINAGVTPGHPGVEHFLTHDDAAARLTEQGRVLASERDDLIAGGADPADLLVPQSPDTETPWWPEP